MIQQIPDRGWRLVLAIASLTALLLTTHATLAAPPVVKTVGVDPDNELVAHQAISGQATRLKGTSDIQASDTTNGVTYIWDTGGGDPAQCTGTVSNKYVIQCTVTYTGSVNQLFTSTLTVQNLDTGETASENYFVQLQSPGLETDVNIAIDEGLWYLHQRMNRYTCGTDPTKGCGTWQGIALPSTSTGENVIDPANLAAFLSVGFSEGGADGDRSTDDAEPYVETVQRALRTTLEQLSAISLSVQNSSYAGSFNPDLNGNGIGLQGDTSDPPYQGGMFIDALVATGTPTWTAETGLDNGDQGVKGRTYKDIVQDLIDAYSFGQNDSGTYVGGWRYGWFNNNRGNSDNSTNQWAAIGMVAAERNAGFSTSVPAEVKQNNLNSLYRTQKSDGRFNYSDSTSEAWGYYATAPSGMVQLAWQGLGRGDANPDFPTQQPRPWDLTENWLRDRFCNSGSATQSVRDYYYGLFSFTKAMLLNREANPAASPSYDCLIDTVDASPSTPFDWYGAEFGQPDTLCNSGNSAPCDGVARTIVNDQTSSGGTWGAWPNGNQYTSTQYPFTTTWAIQMLNQTFASAGEPVAICKIVPNPSIAGQTVTLNGQGSRHQDASREIDSWAWDTDDDGAVDHTGPIVSGVSFPAQVGTYPVRLTVTDDGEPEKRNSTVCNVTVQTPPLAPTADANGPYVFCPGGNWFLDGTGSTNPDDGEFEIPQPGACPDGDRIVSYDWDLDGDGQFGDASGAQPDVTAFYQTAGPASYNAQLRVTDSTAACFPNSGNPDLTGFDVSQVVVYGAGADACNCIEDFFIRSNVRGISLNWAASTDPETQSYNVYRGTISGGPYAPLANTPTPGYADYTADVGQTYYYVVRPVRANLTELCSSEEEDGQRQSRRGRGR